MISHPYAAFKHVVLKCSSKKGEEFTSQQTRKLGWRFIVSGCIEVTSKDGSIKRVYPGDLIVDNDVISNRTIEFIEDTEWYCLSNIGNTELVIPTFIKIEPKHQINAVKDSDLFLAAGSLEIDGNTYVAPYKIRIRKKDCILKANESCYLFQFK